MTAFARLDVKEIKASVPRANFTEAQIEQVADLILAGGGVIRPLVVKQTGIDSYELIDGALEYFAAVRAREKDPRRGELVNAFVVSPKQDTAIREQLTALNGHNGSSAAPPPSSAPTISDPLSAFVTNFVVSSEARINEIRELAAQNQRKMELEVKRLDKEIEQKKGPQDLLDLINHTAIDDLRAKLAFHGADKGKIEAICNARQQQKNGQFETYQALLTAAKGLGERGLLRLIDSVRSYSH